MLAQEGVLGRANWKDEIRKPLAHDKAKAKLDNYEDE
jgi:hypothetical protein